MKYLFLIIVLTSSVDLCAQKVGYSHDLHGNRTQRKLVVIANNNRVAPVKDSTNTEKPDEETMKLAMEYGVSVFPNPTQTNVDLVLNKIPANASTKAILFDNSGRILQNFENIKSRNEVVLAEYKPGIYYLEILISDKEKLSYKIIKQ